MGWRRRRVTTDRDMHFLGWNNTLLGKIMLVLRYIFTKCSMTSRTSIRLSPLKICVRSRLLKLSGRFCSISLWHRWRNTFLGGGELLRKNWQMPRQSSALQAATWLCPPPPLKITFLYLHGLWNSKFQFSYQFCFVAYILQLIKKNFLLQECWRIVFQTNKPQLCG